jgi:hypothetical protein
LELKHVGGARQAREWAWAKGKCTLEAVIIENINGGFSLTRYQFYQSTRPGKGGTHLHYLDGGCLLDGKR